MKKEDSLIEKISSEIVKIRKMKNMTQEELAEKSKIKQPSISRIESGKYPPNISTLRKISEALDVKLNISFENANKRKS